MSPSPDRQTIHMNNRAPEESTTDSFKSFDRGLFRPCIQKSPMAFIVLTLITVLVQSQLIYLCSDCDIIVLVHLCHINLNL